MGWVGQEILRQNAGRVGDQTQPSLHKANLTFRFPDGLLLGVGNRWDNWVDLDFSLLAAADWSVVMPPLRQAIRYSRKFRGYSRVPLADHKKPVNMLPADIVGRLDQIAGALSHSWSLWLHGCTSPLLRARGFPEWRITCNLSAYLPSHVIRGPDFAAYARQILGQTAAMRSLLEDVLKLRLAPKLEPR